MRWERDGDYRRSAAYCPKQGETKAESRGAGLIFLVAFFVWGSLNLGSSSAAGKRAKGLWGTVVAYAAIIAAAQIGFQLATGLDGIAWATGKEAARLLTLFGFKKSDDFIELTLVRYNSPFYQQLSCPSKWGPQGLLRCMENILKQDMLGLF